MEESSTKTTDNRFSDENVRRVVLKFAPGVLIFVAAVIVSYVLYVIYSYGFEGYLDRLCGVNNTSVSDLCFDSDSGMVVFVVGVFALVYSLGFNLWHLLKKKKKIS